jgi:tetratricopeptide (TPR) repeat protein
MKKTLSIISVLCFVFVMVVLLVSCTQQQTPPADTSQTQSPEATAQQPKPPASAIPSSAASPAVSGSPVSSASTNDAASAFIKTGQAALGLMKYDEALSAFNKAVEADKKSAEALVFRAETYWFLKMYAEASTDVENALKINPEYLQAYNVRGNLYYSQQKFDLALADFEKALKIDPKNNAAALGKAKTITELGKYDEALAIVKKEEAAMSDKLPALIQEAAIMKKMKNYSGAIELNKRILKSNPQGIQFMSEIGQCLALENKPQEALEYYNQAEKTLADLEKNSKGGTAMPELTVKDTMQNIVRNRIIVYADLGQYDKVISESEKYLADNKNDPAILHCYAYSFYRMRKDTEAAKQMKKWLETKPEPITAEQYIDMADALYILKEYGKAEKAYKVSEKMDPENPNIYAKLGVFYFTMKDNKKAKINLEKSLSMGLGKADAEDIEKYLKKIPK